MNAETNAAPAKQGAVAVPPHTKITDIGTFLDFKGLLPRLPIQERTARDWTRRGIIPSIRPVPGGRVFYHWPSVEAALIRRQRGGAE